MEKFDSKLEASDGCLLWKGAKTGQGIGQVFVGGRMVSVHRHAFERAHGPIPPNMDVKQTCGNRLCCNPAHLTLVPRKDRIACPGKSFGERNGQSKLTAVAVIAIRASQDSQTVLAQRYGVSVDAVSRVIRRLTWTAV